MSNTRFVPRQTVVKADWLQDVNDLTYAYSPAPTGVPRTAVSKLEEIISLQDFGLISDPTVDNTAAMMAFNAYARANPSHNFNLILPPGQITYSRPDWLQGIRSFKLTGAMTYLFNKSTNPNSTQNIPLIINQDLMLDNASGGVGGTFVPGYRITTTQRFSTNVSMMTVSDASHFAPNTWALIYGYNQGSQGYPVSARYFEYVRVTAVNLATGVVSLQKPLLYKYRQDWLDIQNNAPQAAVGAARLLPLNRAGFNLCESAEFEHIIFGPSLNAPVDPVTSASGTLITAGCYYVGIRNCIIPGFFYPTETRFCQVTGSYIGFTEPDKLVDILRFEGCEIGQLDNGPGCNLIESIGSTYRAPIATLGPRRFISRDDRWELGDINAPLNAQNRSGRSNQYVNIGISTAVDAIDIENPIIDTIDPNEGVWICPAQTGAASNQIILGAPAPATDNALLGYAVRILFGTGKGQYRQINTLAGSYVGATRLATVSSAWTIQPDTTSVYKVERVLPFIAGGGSVSATILSVSLGGNTVNVALTGTGLNDPVLRGLDTGSLLVSTTTTTIIRVSDIYYDAGQNQTTIAGEFSASGVPLGSGGVPQVGEVFTANIVRHVSLKTPRIKGSQAVYNNSNQGSGDSLDICGMIFADDITVESKYRKPTRLEIPFLFMRDYTSLPGYLAMIQGKILKIVVDVKVPYSGALGSAGMNIARPSAETTPVNPAPPNMAINLKTAGVRTVDTTGVYGAQTGDTLVQFATLYPYKQINFQTTQDLTDGPPIGSIIIDYIP